LPKFSPVLRHYHASQANTSRGRKRNFSETIAVQSRGSN
jgi:hypothetical protein